MATPLTQPDGKEDGYHRDEHERLHDGSRDTTVSDYPCESSHNPPIVYSTIKASIGY